MKQMNNQNNKETALTESKAFREDYISHVDVLDKIKAISYLNKDMVLSIK